MMHSRIAGITGRLRGVAAVDPGVCGTTRGSGRLELKNTMALGGKWMGVAFIAVLLAAVLLASPAFAQAQGGNVNVQYVDCSQVQSAVADQGQYGDATAIGDEAVAAIAQELNITQSQVNACLGSIGSDDKVVENDDDDGSTTKTTTTTASEKAGVLSSTIPDKKVLAATGGTPLPGIAFLALALIGTGLSVLRFGIPRDR
jgi:hypothetical protein